MGSRTSSEEGSICLLTVFGDAVEETFSADKSSSLGRERTCRRKKIVQHPLGRQSIAKPRNQSHFAVELNVWLRFVSFRWVNISGGLMYHNHVLAGGVGIFGRGGRGIGAGRG